MRKMRWDTRVIVLLLFLHLFIFIIFYSTHLRPAPYSYITFTNSDNYGKGVIALAVSLKDVQSQYPLIVLVTNEVSSKMRQQMTKVGCKIMDVKPLPLPPELSLEFQRWGPAFTKYRAFEMTDYKKLIWLDTDLLVIRNIDSLFELSAPLSATVDADASTCLFKEHRLRAMNSGIMSLTPNHNTFLRLMNSLNNKTLLSSGKINDQDVLMHANPDWEALPYPQYGAQITHCECEPDERMWNNHIRILHFTAGAMSLPKPWDYNPQKDPDSIDFPDCLHDIYQLWWTKYKRAHKL